MEDFEKALLILGGAWLLNQHVQNDICTKLDKCGFGLASNYLRSARHHYKTSKLMTRFSDTKSNARNCFEVLVQGFSGKKSVSEGLRHFKSLKIIGEAEYDVMKNYYAFLSKHGAHPPLASEKDAELALVMVENLADRIVRHKEASLPIFKARGPGF